MEAELLELALDGQALREGHFGARLHRTLDAPNRLGCPVGRTELASVVHHFFPVVLRLVDVVDQPQLLRLFKREGVSGNHQFDGLALADQAGESLRTASAGKHAKVHFG